MSPGVHYLNSRKRHPRGGTRGRRAGCGPAGAVTMFSFSRKKKDKKDKKDKAAKGKEEGKAKKGGADGATFDEEDDGYGDLYDEGALEALAEEGIDSDIEAEENERYNRRPRPADGPVDRSTEGGFLARQPCRAALVAPTAHSTAHNTHEKPDHELQLDFVYGYRAHDCRHNLVYNIDGLVVYPAAATGVCYDGGDAQQFFTAHTDDIALDMHPEREIIATGQWQGPVHLRLVLHHVQAAGRTQATSARCALLRRHWGSFSRPPIPPSPAARLAVATDARQLQGRRQPRLQLRVQPHDGRLVTAVKHLKFWVMEGGYLVGKRGCTGGGRRSTIFHRFHPDGSTLTERRVRVSVGGRRRTVHSEVRDGVSGTGARPVRQRGLHHQRGRMKGTLHAVFRKCSPSTWRRWWRTSRSSGKPLCSYDGKSPCVKSIFLEERSCSSTKGPRFSSLTCPPRRAGVTGKDHQDTARGRRAQARGQRRAGTHHPPFLLLSPRVTIRHFAYDMYQPQIVLEHRKQGAVGAYSSDGKYVVMILPAFHRVREYEMSREETSTRGDQRREVLSRRDFRWSAARTITPRILRLHAPV